MYDKQLPIGSEVLILNRSIYPKQNEYIKGTIQDSTLSENLSHHSSNSWYEIIYAVKGENGAVYVETYGRDFIGNNVFFMTKEDYIKYLTTEKINKNYRKIYELNCENETYNQIIKNLEQSKPKEKIKSI